MQDAIGMQVQQIQRGRLQRRSVVAFIASLVAVSLLAAGCASTGLDPYFADVDSDANVYVSPGRSDIAKIAVLPFKGPTELIGASVSDLVVTEILRTRKYTLVERSQMAGVLSEAELAMAGLSESRAVEVAKMLGADGVVIGTVDEYATQAKGGKTYAVAGVALRLINCGTGQIIWSADLAEMASSADTPLSAHGRAVVHELMAGLYQAWARQRSFAPPRASASSADPVGGPRAASQAPVVSPAVPAGVAVSDLGLREATVKWQADNVVASRYRVERALAEAGPFAVVGEVKPSRGSFRDDQGLKDAAVYYYRVVAVGETGLASKPSPVVETMTAPPPDPPAAVKALAPSSRCVAVSWTPPRAEGVVKYRVERAEAGEAPKWALRSETDKTTFTDGGRAGCDVADSTKYLYRVTAVNRVGAVGEPSAGVEVETLPPPAVVADFFATPLQVRCVPLSWAANPEPDVEGYELERAEGAAGAFAKLERMRGRGTTTFLDGRRDPGNLPDAQTYRYRIRAFNDVGAFGEWTPPAEATTRSVPPPPQGIAAAGGMPRAAEVSWTVSEDEKVVAYRVQRAEGAGGRWEDVAKIAGRECVRLLDRAGAAATAPTGRLKDGTGYHYRVCAINTAGAESAWSEEALAVTKPAPVPPAGLGTTQDVAGKVVLVWEPNPESDIVAYVVESRAADGSRWRDVVRVESCVAEETGLAAGEHRVYRIKAVDADTHESAWSAEAVGAARPLPASPQALSAAWTGGGATLTWRPPQDGMSEYRLYKKGLLSSERIATSPEPQTTIDAATVGKRITVYVTAVDEEGLESRPSEALEIQAPGA